MKKLTGRRVIFRGLEGKTLAKARKVYRSEIARGLTENQAKRNARGAAVGKTAREAQGHKDEFIKIKKRGTAYKPAPRGRLDKKKPGEWALYSFFDGVSNQASDSDSEILGMTSYDLTKTQYKNYESSGSQDALFAMHQYMERQLQHYLKLEMELASIKDLNVEDNTEYSTRHRRFLWQLTDMQSGEIRYHLIYEKGQIIEKDMWEGFNSLDFKINIRELRLWE